MVTDTCPLLPLLIHLLPPTSAPTPAPKPASTSLTQPPFCVTFTNQHTVTQYLPVYEVINRIPSLASERSALVPLPFHLTLSFTSGLYATVLNSKIF